MRVSSSTLPRKFGLQGHVRYVTADADRTGEWRMVDACVVNWILATVSKGVFDIIRRDRHDAFTLWNAVIGIFQDNELQRAVYLEAELRTLQQGDMTINAYCTKLKRLADQLRDIGHPVSEPSQVLNLLRGLNPKYRYVKPVITSKYPPHTFMSARSFLILEELGADHDANTEATQALAASHGDRPGGSSGNHGSSSGSTDGSFGSSAPRDNNRRNSSGRPNNRGDRRRGRAPPTFPTTMPNDRAPSPKLSFDTVCADRDDAVHYRAHWPSDGHSCPRWHYQAQPEVCFGDHGIHLSNPSQCSLGCQGSPPVSLR
ncbi:unnamed protein product [Miscanthus lutarioriparius]|uniref:Retrotransposon gag domain-containing protein n=1 Tax=Miscanthus lutarioriparius TaxID=422564 RepID=A0A811SLF8_9POAL|nr:unnamed protein product [Miscanthus lutarioriparius]